MTINVTPTTVRNSVLPRRDRMILPTVYISSVVNDMASSLSASTGTKFINIAIAKLSDDIIVVALGSLYFRICTKSSN